MSVAGSHVSKSSHLTYVKTKDEDKQYDQSVRRGSRDSKTSNHSHKSSISNHSKSSLRSRKDSTSSDRSAKSKENSAKEKSSRSRSSSGSSSHKNRSRNSSRNSSKSKSRSRSSSKSKSRSRSRSRSKSSSKSSSRSSDRSQNHGRVTSKQKSGSSKSRSRSSGSSRSSRSSKSGVKVTRRSHQSDSSTLPSEAGCHTKRTGTRSSDYDTPSYGYTSDERNQRINVTSESQTHKRQAHQNKERDSKSENKENREGQRRPQHFLQQSDEQQPSWSASRANRILRTGPVSSAASRSFSANREAEIRSLPRVYSNTMPSSRQDSQVRPAPSESYVITGPMKELSDLNSSLCYGGGIDNYYYNAAANHRARIRSAYSSSGGWSDLKSGALNSNRLSAEDLSGIYSRKLERKYRELRDMLNLDLSLQVPQPPSSAKQAWVGPGSPLSQTMIEKRRLLAWAIAKGTVPRQVLRVRRSSGGSVRGRKKGRGIERRVLGSDLMSEDSWSVAPSLEILEYEDSVSGNKKHVTFNEKKNREETVAEMVERLRKKQEQEERRKREDERDRKNKEIANKKKVQLDKLDNSVKKSKKSKKSNKKSKDKDSNSNKREGSESDRSQGSSSGSQSSKKDSEKSRSRSRSASSSSSASSSRSGSSNKSDRKIKKKKRSKSLSPSSTPRVYSEYYLRPIDADPLHRASLRDWLREKNRLLRNKKREERREIKRKKEEQEEKEREKEKKRLESKEQVQHWMEQKRLEEEERKRVRESQVTVQEATHPRRGASAPPVGRAEEKGQGQGKAIGYGELQRLQKSGSGGWSKRDDVEAWLNQSYKSTADKSPVKVKYEVIKVRNPRAMKRSLSAEAVSSKVVEGRGSGEDGNLSTWDRLTRGLRTEGANRGQAIGATTKSLPTAGASKGGAQVTGGASKAPQRGEASPRGSTSPRVNQDKPLSARGRDEQNKRTTVIEHKGALSPKKQPHVNEAKITYKPEYIPKRPAVKGLPKKNNQSLSPVRSSSANPATRVGNTGENKNTRSGSAVNLDKSPMKNKRGKKIGAKKKKNNQSVESFSLGPPIPTTSVNLLETSGLKEPPEPLKIQNFDFGTVENSSRNELDDLGRISPRIESESPMLRESHNYKDTDKFHVVSGSTDREKSFEWERPQRKPTPEPKMSTPRSPTDSVVFKVTRMVKLEEEKVEDSEELKEKVEDNKILKENVESSEILKDKEIEQTGFVFGRPKSGRVRVQAVQPVMGGDIKSDEQFSNSKQTKTSFSWMSDAGFDDSGAPGVTGPGNTDQLASTISTNITDDMFSADFLRKDSSGYTPSFNQARDKKVGRVAAVKPTKLHQEPTIEQSDVVLNKVEVKKQEDLSFLSSSDTTTGLKSIVKRSPQPWEDKEPSVQSTEDSLHSENGTTLRRSSKRVTFTEEIKSFEVKDETKAETKSNTEDKVKAGVKDKLSNVTADESEKNNDDF